MIEAFGVVVFASNTISFVGQKNNNMPCANSPKSFHNYFLTLYIKKLLKASSTCLSGKF